MQEIAAYFPNHFEDRIKQSGVFQRKRGVKSGLDLLKIFLLYAVSGISFRMLALAASALSISTNSDTAWRKKLLHSIPLFQMLLHQILSALLPSAPSEIKSARNVYLVDASVFRQQGKQQTQQRIHLCYHLNQNRIAQVKVSDIHTAESLSHFSRMEGDIILADAGYGTAKNYALSREQIADVILRITPSHFPVYNREETVTLKEYRAIQKENQRLKSKMKY